MILHSHFSQTNDTPQNERHITLIHILWGTVTLPSIFVKGDPPSHVFMRTVTMTWSEKYANSQSALASKKHQSLTSTFGNCVLKGKMTWVPGLESPGPVLWEHRNPLPIKGSKFRAPFLSSGGVDFTLVLFGHNNPWAPFVSDDDPWSYSLMDGNVRFLFLSLKDPRPWCWKNKNLWPLFLWGLLYLILNSEWW